MLHDWSSTLLEISLYTKYVHLAKYPLSSHLPYPEMD